MRIAAPHHILYYSMMYVLPMMTSSNGNTFRVTGPLWEESTGHRWIPLTKANDAELWCFVLCASEPTVAGDLRRHRAHYDVIAMTLSHSVSHCDVCTVHRILFWRLFISLICLNLNMKVIKFLCSLVDRKSLVSRTSWHDEVQYMSDWGRYLLVLVVKTFGQSLLCDANKW